MFSVLKQRRYSWQRVRGQNVLVTKLQNIQGKEKRTVMKLADFSRVIGLGRSTCYRIRRYLSINVQFKLVKLRLQVRETKDRSEMIPIGRLFRYFFPPYYLYGSELAFLFYVRLPHGISTALSRWAYKFNQAIEIKYS